MARLYPYDLLAPMAVPCICKQWKYGRQSDKGRTIVQWFMRTNKSLSWLVPRNLDNLIQVTNLIFWRTQKQRKYFMWSAKIVWVFLMKSFVSQPFYNKYFINSLQWTYPFGLKSVTDIVSKSTILDQFCTCQEHVLVILFSCLPTQRV